MNIHEFIDFDYGPDGDEMLLRQLAEGADPNAPGGEASETLLHVAVRRRRETAARILLENGADIDARNAFGKSSYAHAIRRGFAEIVDLLSDHGADTTLNSADRLAVAVVNGELEAAAAMIADNPDAVRTGNPEEDRLLADVAGRNQTEPVKMLIDAGADLTASGLDDGTPLHQAAWFGQPANARLLIDAGAPLNVLDSVHRGSPLGWAIHGSRFSGGADQQRDVYVELVRMLLEAGASFHATDHPDSDSYLQRLLNDA